MIEKFWIVARNGSHNTLTAQIRHASLNEATTEASRLAQKEGVAFYVLECMGAAQPATPPVEWVVASAPKEIFND